MPRKCVIRIGRAIYQTRRGKYVSIIHHCGNWYWLSHYTGEIKYLGDVTGLKEMIKDFGWPVAERA